MPDGHLVRRGGFNKPENEQSQTDHKYHVFPPCRPCVSRRVNRPGNCADSFP